MRIGWVAAALALATLPVRADEYARAGRWTIYRENGNCYAATMTQETTLVFELVPQSFVAIINPSWSIPNGDYQITIDYPSPTAQEQTIAVQAQVDIRVPNRFMVLWKQEPGEVEKLVSFDWLRFHFGSHQYFVNTNGGEAAAMLPMCAQHAHDPFATMQ